jgi:hypothetical protein
MLLAARKPAIKLMATINKATMTSIKVKPAWGNSAAVTVMASP